MGTAKENVTKAKGLERFNQAAPLMRCFNSEVGLWFAGCCVASGPSRKDDELWLQLGQSDV